MSTISFAMMSSQLSIYIGFPIFIFGIIGNLINLRLLFPMRTNTCSFLLFVSSFFNLIALLFGLLPRVLSIGFGIDASLTNLIWCKSRLFISYCGTITSTTCICFASIDRFFLSCRSMTWRNRSNINTVKIAVSIAIPIIIGINVPYLLFYTIIPVGTNTNNTNTKCSPVNSGLVFYGNYFVRPILISVLPGAILCITAWLTYRNITSITHTQLRGTFQRGLTSMVFLQIVVFIIPITPFATMNIYQVLTSSIVKTSYRLSQEMLILDISNIILYVNYASNFYVYLISASSYRRDFLRFVLFFYRRNRWNNHIEPLPRKQIALNKVSPVKQFPLAIHKINHRVIH